MSVNFDTKITRKDWHAQSVDAVALRLDTDISRGISNKEAAHRLDRYGANELKEGKQESILSATMRHVLSPLNVVLILSGIATFFLKEYSSTIVIFVTVAFNILISVFQEGKAGKAFKKLAESQTRFATVIRGGIKTVVPARELVPGDLVEIEIGNYVPADMRIVISQNASINEAALTGEWNAVNKSADTLASSMRANEQSNMAFMGTAVAFGEAFGLVTATGINTQLGAIAESVGFQNDETPLQKAISRLARSLIIMVSVILVVLILLGLLRGEGFADLLLMAIALAVSAIPEGLPVAITVILIFGMRNILARGGFVRSLLAAETLGSTTVILTDKTGTLTKGDMEVVDIVTLESQNVTGERTQDVGQDRALRAAVLATDAFVETKGEEKIFHGRPVERALLRAGVEQDLYQDKLLEHEPRIDFLKFESSRRFAASLHSAKDKKNIVYITGAPEVSLEYAGRVLTNTGSRKLTKIDRALLTEKHHQLSENGARLIGISMRETSLSEFPKSDDEIKKEVLDGSTFVGFMVLADGIREDVPAAIKKAKEAGSRVIMLTGDYLGTARWVAQQVGIASESEVGHTGSDIELMSDEELTQILLTSNVFARVLPAQKLRIAKLMKKAGHVVAMTGDGVNDAPALREANIGVAVGSGTEVAKESADLVLVNNSFSIIVYAIEEGRRLLDNIKKSVAFLLATNFSEIVLVGGAVLLGWSLPLLPKQILWENVIGGGLLNFVFAFEPAEKGIMKRDPASATMRTIMTPTVKLFSIAVSLVTGLLKLVLFWYLLKYTTMSLDEVRTIIFIAVSIDIVFMVFSFKNFDVPVWRSKLFSNSYIFWGLALALAGLAAAIFVPTLATLFSVVMPAEIPYGLLALFGIMNVLLIELSKKIIFKSSS